VVRRHPEAFAITALSAFANADGLIAAAKEFCVPVVCIGDAAKANKVQAALPGVRVLSGEEGLAVLAALEAVDTVVLAVAGGGGIAPAYAALRAGKTLAVANKEALVAAGQFLREAATAYGGRIVPVDSEHSAIFQCLEGGAARPRRLILTASGGPFRGYTKARLEKVTIAEALRHPTWAMGKKVTVDSATMMNKALEIIEAYWLFKDYDLPPADYLIHPQSIVHSMVEFADGAVLAQLSVPSMEIPIQYALTHPKRLPTAVPTLDLAAVGSLTFDAPDEEAFPAPALARLALQHGGAYPAVLSAANEAAVDLFLQGAISYSRIVPLVGEALLAPMPRIAVTIDTLPLFAARARDTVNHKARGI
jgi:1-deoxy-D-xylulose-5-phosphate reductoisomerase